MAKKYSIRKFFGDVHLWLGIASGLILFVVCVTGTIYTFKTEIERVANPAKYYAKGNGEKLSADVLLSRLEKRYNGKVTSLVIPADASMNYQVGLKTEASKENKGHIPLDRENARAKEAGNAEPKKLPGRGGEEKAEGRTINLFVDPYTGLVAGEQGGGISKFFTVVMQLHRWLLLDRSIGALIVGTSTIIFVIIILSGLVIWFPKRIATWRKGYRIKFNANWKRINHDLHKSLGFYAFILLLVMALTGLCWSFEWYRNGLGKVLGAKVFKGRGEKPMSSNLTSDSTLFVPISVHIQKADSLFPYRGIVRVGLPSEVRGAVVISKSKVGFFATPGADKVQLDRFTGQQLKTEYFSQKPFNEKIADSIKPLHTGEIYGLLSKILYFVACLFASSLPVTGTLIWINKLKKRAKGKRNVEEVPLVIKKDVVGERV